MLNPFRKLFSQNPAKLTRSFVFFILFYLYLWLGVNLRLIYHGAGAITDFPVFYRGWAFFREFASYPGGLVQYIAAFLAQFFYYSWAGAFVVTLLAWLIFICTGYFLRAIKAPRLYWLRFTPAILLLITYTRYAPHFVTTMALLTALVFIYLYLRITRGSGTFFVRRKNVPDPFRLIVFLALSVVLYAVAGGAYLLFAVLCAIYELFFRRRWRLGLLCLLLALIIPYVEGILIFGVSAIDAYSKLMPFSWEVVSFEIRKRMLTIVYILYLFLPLTALGIGLWRVFVESSALLPNRLDILGTCFDEIKKKVKDKLDEKIFLRHLQNSRLRVSIKSLVLFVAAGAAVLFSYNDKMKAVFEVDYYSCHNMWPQVIATARRHPRSIFVVHALNRALYHTGRLGYDMFYYPQNTDNLFLVTKEVMFVSWKRFGTYLDLGYMNMAEQDLNDSIGRFGEHPTILKHLALISMVKGDVGTARIYLGALSRTLFDADWADDYLDRLEQDPNLSKDEQIQHLRSMMMKENTVLVSFKSTGVLPKLLAANRQNRMAFEYLMTWYLLVGNLDGFVRNLYRLDDFNYPEIPQLYEEAILYIFAIGKKVDLQGRRISRQSYQRFDAFNRTLRRYGGDKQAAFNELRKNHGDTYLFYSLYKFPGMKK